MPYNYVLTLFMKHPFILGQRTPYSITFVHYPKINFQSGKFIEGNNISEIHLIFLITVFFFHLTGTPEI